MRVDNASKRLSTESKYKRLAFEQGSTEYSFKIWFLTTINRSIEIQSKWRPAGHKLDIAALKNIKVFAMFNKLYFKFVFCFVNL